MPFLSVSHTWIWPFHVLKLQKHVDSYWLWYWGHGDESRADIWSLPLFFALKMWTCH
jgi:hypothetical protein